jgi:hypothetical protein
MSPTYRCPIDETVFQTSKVERMPTLEGHPECPGPVCSEKFGTKKNSTVKPAGGAFDAPGPESAGPIPLGQGWGA